MLSFFPRKRCCVAAVLVICGFVSGPATAQLVVNDPTLILGQYKQALADGYEFERQYKRWRATKDHYEQQLIRLKRLSFGDSQMEDSFPERDLNYGMEDMCRAKGTAEGGARDLMARVLKPAQPQMDGAVLDEQQKVCERMVQAENAKYNESVRMLKTLIQRNREFQALQRQRDQVGQEQGALAANDNETQRFVARIAMDLDYWQARMTAYQSYIESLKWDQARLAKRALRGKKGQGPNGIAGQVVQAATLKAALSR